MFMVESGTLLSQEEIDCLLNVNLDNSINYVENLPHEFPWKLLNFIDYADFPPNLDKEYNFRSPEKQLNELICDVMIPEQRRVYEDLLEYRLFGTLADHLNSVDFLSKDKLLKFRRRSYLDNHLESLIESGSNFSFLMLDLDKFSRVNNTYGHQMGDTVLENLGDLIRGELRQSDVPYRYGGEEIGIILPDTNIENAYLVAEKLRNSIDNNLVIGSRINDLGKMNSYNLERMDDSTICIDNSITTSIGVTEFLGKGDLINKVIERADKALYESKYLGRNRISVLKE